MDDRPCVQSKDIIIRAIGQRIAFRIAAPFICVRFGMNDALAPFRKNPQLTFIRAVVNDARDDKLVILTIVIGRYGGRNNASILQKRGFGGTKCATKSAKKAQEEKIFHG